MIEVAPSGAYDEEWHRLPGSDGPCGHVVVDGAVREGWYVVGDHAMYVRDRAVAVPDERRIDELVAALDVDDPSQRATAEALVDCEFSYARRVGDRWVVQLSTLPWRQGSELDMSPLGGGAGWDGVSVDARRVRRAARHAVLERAEARMLPPRAYTSTEVLAAERDRIFSSVWTCVARSADLPAVGDHLAADVPAGDGRTGEHESIVVLRGDEGALAAFRNACVHRCSALVEGRATRPASPARTTRGCTGSTVSCIAAPYMQRTVDAAAGRSTSPTIGSRRVAPAEWEGFVFVSPPPNPRRWRRALEPLTRGDRPLSAGRLRAGAPTGRRVGHELEVPGRELHGRLSRVQGAPEHLRQGRRQHRRHHGAPGHAAATHSTRRDRLRLVEYGVAHPDNTRSRARGGTPPRWRRCSPRSSCRCSPTGCGTSTSARSARSGAHPLGRLGGARRVRVAARSRGLRGDRCSTCCISVNAEDRPIVEGVARGVRHDDARRGPLSYLEGNVFDFDRYISRSCRRRDRSLQRLAARPIVTDIAWRL